MRCQQCLQDPCVCVKPAMTDAKYQAQLAAAVTDEQHAEAIRKLTETLNEAVRAAIEAGLRVEPVIAHHEQVGGLDRYKLSVTLYRPL